MNSDISQIKYPADIPARNFYRRLLDPLIAIGLLYLMSVLIGQGFSAQHVVLAILTFFISSTVFSWSDPWRDAASNNFLSKLKAILLTWSLVSVLLLFFGYVAGLSVLFAQQAVVLWLLLTPPVLLLGQIVLQKASSGLRRTGIRSVVLVGVNELSVKLAERVDENPDLRMEVSGFFDDRDISRQPEEQRVPLLGSMSDIPAYVRQNNINTIFISQPISAQPRIRKLLNELQDTTASIYFLPDIYVFDLIQARFDSVAGLPVVAICESPFTGINSMIKRGSDIVLASIIQLMLLPVMLGIAIAIKATSPGPVIFRQRRYGLDGEEIIVYKFRSMTVCEDGARVVQATKDDQRITRIGAFLRKTSLDELPQFFNVLQGRMSIVGPRPHAVAHNELYRKQIKGYMLRHKVRPGITGWAQVNGLRGETDTLDKMEARIAYDLDYLKRWSLALDLWIILRTFKVVLMRDNAY
ncbi:MAG: undecaprenyl-phosphate glucose phosphotransferase [Burkholderiaceae bacterium]|uniref:Undecaprenyl-phosphate glucose phosphotransferase n=1 Tax=Herminiimonas contaminans TaxID=1111140 RepID=A0ABS0EUA3_9BURK|nr:MULTISPECIES: undecaprenyl-phosphate glucose phosphotransferase [Oxalobacteraceae]MBF8178419.1 undecaprenyl-phosphate glucose phosphotransferase [Herminiimonas contaminans]MBX9798510.1 undecaprenyl-phosphate glucose phosphotransferase [Burkholderiaceae bacterium]